MQLGVQPGGLEGGRIGLERVALALCGQGLERGFGGEHAGLDRGVAALDARGVEKAGVVADQPAAREHQLGQALQAAGGDRARTVLQALAAFEVLADLGVGLVALHLLEGRQMRVARS